MREKLRELAKAAPPPGDWASGGDEIYAGSGDTYVEIAGLYGDFGEQEANGDLIVAAANALPELLDRLDRLEGALGELLSASFRDDDFLTANGIPMTATPGVRRAVRKARAALEDR